MSLMFLRSARVLALLAAFPVSLSLYGCGGDEVKYEAKPAVSGATQKPVKKPEEGQFETIQ